MIAKSFMILGATMMVSLPVLAGDAEKSHDQKANETFHVNAFLCKSPEYAVKFAIIASRVDQDEEASAIVGKAFNGEVCVKYLGFASVDGHQTVYEDGIPYRLIALRFKEDNRVAWAAEPDYSSLPPSSGAKEPTLGAPKEPSPESQK